jgi:hypothetical protein
MLSAAIHRKWAREFPARAQEAPSHNRKVKYLQLAVCNSVRARTLEAETRPDSDRQVAEKRNAKQVR